VGIYQGEKTENKINELIEKFNVQGDFPANGVIRSPDLCEVSLSINGSEKRTIEPATTLTDKFRYRVYSDQFVTPDC
jgi:hypothetical protein